MVKEAKKVCACKMDGTDMRATILSGNLATSNSIWQ